MFKKIIDTINSYELNAFGWIISVVGILGGIPTHGLMAIPYGLGLVVILILVGIAYSEATKENHG